jgi:hypothetical protein
MSYIVSEGGGVATDRPAALSGGRATWVGGTHAR